MSLKRLFQLLVTALLGQGLSILSQLLIPPLFLHSYLQGSEVYGEWIALSASVSYLGTLNIGVQTYVSNEMTILYAAGRKTEAQGVQASAFRLLLCLFLLIATFALIFFAFPPAVWLRMHHVTRMQSAVALYLLTLQIGANMFFSLLTNSYMALGLLHRGNYISSAQRFVAIVAVAIAVHFQASLPKLALFQLLAYLLFMIVALIDLRRLEPDLVPDLRKGSWKQIKSLLAPSGHFGLISVAGFLTWQGPVLLIQRILGANSVTIFALVRVIFQMSRQLLGLASSIFAQDITLMVGRGDRRQLYRLYDLSERFVLFLIPIISVTFLLLCPFLLTVWLHNRSLYDPRLCILMAVISAVLGLKEHKVQFQFASNKHERLSIFSVSGYVVMLAAAVPLMWGFGLMGFLYAWLGWEILQTAGTIALNKKLFGEDQPLDLTLLYRFVAVTLASFAGAAVLAYRVAAWQLKESIVAALAVALVVAAVGYFVFRLEEIRQILVKRMTRQAAA